MQLITPCSLQAQAMGDVHMHRAHTQLVHGNTTLRYSTYAYRASGYQSVSCNGPSTMQVQVLRQEHECPLYMT